MGWQQVSRSAQIYKIDALTAAANRDLVGPMQQTFEIASHSMAVPPDEFGHVRLREPLGLDQMHAACKHEDQPLGCFTRWPKR
jgi:hypothetical protein